MIGSSATERATQHSVMVSPDPILAWRQKPPTLDDYTRALGVLAAATTIRQPKALALTPTANREPDGDFAPSTQRLFGWHCQTLVNGKVITTGDGA